MRIDNVITLSNGTNYLLLDELKYKNGKYFFCIEVDKSKKLPLVNYSFIKEVNKDSRLYACLVNDKKVTSKLYDLLVKNYSQLNF